MIGRRFGDFCHMCGEGVCRLPDPKTGKHKFCGAPCRNAHGRANRKRNKRSDALKRSAALRRAARSGGKKIAGEASCRLTSSAQIAGSRPAKKIGRKKVKRGKK